MTQKKSTNGQGARAWLLWTGLLLAGTMAALLVLSGSLTSWAAPRIEAGEVEVAQANRASVAEPFQAATLLSSSRQTTETVLLPFVAKGFRQARITLDKAATPTTVTTAPGQTVTYTVTVQNAGDSTATLLSIEDTLPTGFTFQSMAAGSDVTDPPAGTSGTITWAGPFEMPPGDELRVIYVVSPSQEIGQHTNYVDVTADGAVVPAQPASATITVEPHILLEDNFESGIDRWTPFLNYHRLEEGQWYWGATDGVGGSGALTHDCCNGDKEAADALMMYMGQGAEQWTDYKVETKLLLRGGVDGDGNWSLSDGDPIGIWVRGQYEESDTRAQWVTGYYVVLAGKPDQDNLVVRLAQLQTLTDCWDDACNNPQNLYCFNNPHVLVESAPLGAPFDRNRWYTLEVTVQGPQITVRLDGQQVISFADPKEPFLTGTVGFKVHETQTASFDDLIVTPLY